MTLASLSLRHPRWVDGGIRLDRIPPLAWLAGQALALWPTGAWMLARMRDGSDDPLGLLALLALGAVTLAHRRELRVSPGLGWLALAALGTLVATAARTGVAALPPAMPLVGSLIAILAMACGLLAFLPRRVAALPLLGLAILALPLLSSLQFYAGFPLRVLTAEASRWLLAPLFEVSRSGSSLLVDGQLVIVDAPCSGIQMAWFGYFTACVAALWMQHSTARFASRLPVVGAFVMAGNIVRNSLLVGLEASGRGLAGGAHDALGLLILGCVCFGIGRVMGPATGTTSASTATATWIPAVVRGFQACDAIGDRLFANRFTHRILHKLVFGGVVLACMGAASIQPFPTDRSAASAPSGKAGTPAAEAPRTWDGRVLRPLALSDVEHRFARRFPGTIARLTDGEQTLVLREVRQPTRMLHPAADCYRAAGWRVDAARLERDARERIWRCFVATDASGRRLRVCERIEDAAGVAFTDTSAWYWAAAAGTSTGPWQAVTLARSIE